jgi:hypothetical protein
MAAKCRCNGLRTARPRALVPASMPSSGQRLRQVGDGRRIEPAHAEGVADLGAHALVETDRLGVVGGGDPLDARTLIGLADRGR